MAKDIVHKGRVLEVAESDVIVSVIAESACSSCKVKSACGMSESAEKVVCVVTDFAAAYHVGEEVNVSIKQSMGLKAVFYAYILPFLAVFGSLVGFTQADMGEGASGLLSLGVLVLYYVVFYLFRNRIEREISFEISKI